MRPGEGALFEGEDAIGTSSAATGQRAVADPMAGGAAWRGQNAWPRTFTGGRVLTSGEGRASAAFEDFCAPPAGGSATSWTYERPSVGFVISGWFEYEGGVASGLVGPGALILGNRGESFAVRHFDELGNRRLVAVLEPGLLDEVASELGRPARMRSGAIPPGLLASYAFGLMLAISRGNDDANFLLAGSVLDLPAVHAAGAAGATDRRRVADVIRYMEAHFDEPCPLATLAELAGVSRYRLIRLFRTVTGATPNRYLACLRLRAAATMLLVSTKPIAEVAYACGFNDISHFYALFRSAFRCTPRVWRLRF